MLIKAIINVNQDVQHSI